MLVVAGPPGSGKTTFFPVTAFGVDAFNIDDRCAQILGSYRAIPRDVRRAVATQCERVVNARVFEELALESNPETLRRTCPESFAPFAKEATRAAKALAARSVGESKH